LWSEKDVKPLATPSGRRQKLLTTHMSMIPLGQPDSLAVWLSVVFDAHLLLRGLISLSFAGCKPQK